MGIQSYTNEDPRFYGIQTLNIQKLNIDCNRQYVKISIFLQTSYVNSIVNGRNHYCDIQNQS
jgi:hypothetical protein